MLAAFIFLINAPKLKTGELRGWGRAREVIKEQEFVVFNYV